MTPTDVDLAMLRLAGQRFRHAGALEHAIREQFDCSSTVFWQRVNRLLDDPAAAIAEPVLTGRLRRLRDARTSARSAAR